MLPAHLAQLLAQTIVLLERPKPTWVIVSGVVIGAISALLIALLLFLLRKPK
jgi:hypothetical protein